MRLIAEIDYLVELIRILKMNIHDCIFDGYVKKLSL